MSGVRVVIATTRGPIEVRRISLEHSDVSSAACIENTDAELPISAAYNSFVRPPTGIIQRYFEHGAYLLELSDRIDVGDSWKLGAFIAHALQNVGRLAMGSDECDQVIWVSGDVQRDLGVPEVAHIDEKLRRSAVLFADLSERNVPFQLYLPAKNAERLDDALLREVGAANGSVVPVTSAGDMLEALALPSLVTETNTIPVQSRRWFKPVAATAATVVIVLAASTLFWLKLERPPAPAAKLASPNLFRKPFRSNLSTKTIVALLSSKNVEGISTVTGTRFVMHLGENGEATVKLDIPSTDAVMHDRGRWWVENRKYCYKFSRFGTGRKRCRHVFEENGKIMIMLLSGRIVDWKISPARKDIKSP